MQTVTIDILNRKVVRLLQDLELMQLIRLRKDKLKTTNFNIEIYLEPMVPHQMRLETKY
jgi:hypothetical protein